MDKTLQDLYNGIKAYHAERYSGNNAAKMQDLIDNGQHPDFYFIICSDSRYDPSQFPTIEAGDSFKSEHVANLVPPHDVPEGLAVAAAIDYAVNHLKVKHIIIMGHTHCGGVQGLVNDMKDGYVGKWLQTAKDVMNRVAKSSDMRKTCDSAEKETIKWSLENLQAYPCVEKALKDGNLVVHGWRYDIETGAVEAYNKAKDDFEFFFDPSKAGAKSGSVSSIKPPKAS